MKRSKKNEKDPEIHELISKMREKGIAFLTPFPDRQSCMIMYTQYYEDEETYAKIEENIHKTEHSIDRPRHAVFVKERDGIKLSRFPKVPYQLVREELNLVFNHTVVCGYLSTFYPRSRLTINLVELCYYIMSIIIRKANFISHINSIQIDACYDDSYYKDPESALYLSFLAPSGRTPEVLQIFKALMIQIPCYRLSEKRGPEFKLLDLLKDKQKLRIFFDFWRTVPDAAFIFSMLHNHFKLPKDICDMIICMASKGGKSLY